MTLAKKILNGVKQALDENEIKSIKIYRPRNPKWSNEKVTVFKPAIKILASPGEHFFWLMCTQEELESFIAENNHRKNFWVEDLK